MFAMVKKAMIAVGHLVLRGTLAVAILAVIPRVASGEPSSAPHTDCQMVSDFWLDHHVGETITVSGRYEWGPHSNSLYLDGCGDQSIRISFNDDVSAKINQFLHLTYPGINFGGGYVWGVFTGEVVGAAQVVRGIPVRLFYLRVGDVRIDDQKKMKFGHPAQ